MSRAISKGQFEVLSDEIIMALINNYSTTHIKCLKIDGIITINCYGLWCSIDDPEPKEE